MKRLVSIYSVILALLLIGSIPAWSADGAGLYKTRCAGCHGASGEGKPAMKAPALKGDAMSAEAIQQLLTQGASGKKAPHSKAVSGLDTEQAKAIADYVKTL